MRFPAGRKMQIITEGGEFKRGKPVEIKTA